ncbi:MAG: hypothetical protein ACQKBY_12180 [Verrucomicrobiales bacterium]
MSANDVRAEIDEMFRPLVGEASVEADLILDLRELLLSNGHPGTCVRCFFDLFQVVDQKRKPLLGPLRNYLQERLEIVVQAGERVLEALPMEARPGDDLERFCRRAIRTVQWDRSYAEQELTLRFRYREAA